MNDGRRTCLSHMFEAVAPILPKKLDEEGLEEDENNACPTCGSCSGMYTANSMNCLTEAIGMGLRGMGPSRRLVRPAALAKHAGMQIMDLVEKDIRPRNIMTEAAFHNAETVDMALGCSTNTMLPPARHRPRVRYRAVLRYGQRDQRQDAQPVPPGPAGDTYMEDLERAGGVYAVMAELAQAGLLDTAALTCTGRTVAENLEGVVNRNEEIIRPLDNPYSRTGGIAVLKGNLAPDGCVVKQSAVAPEMMVHEGPARVFDSEDDAIRPSTTERSWPGMWWSSAMRAPRAGPDAGDAQPHLCHCGHGAG